MCGRYGVDLTKLPASWGEIHNTLTYQSWNVAPGQRVAVIVPGTAPGTAAATAATAAAVVRPFRWGLIPHWWKDATPPRASFNARSETAASKPMFRDAFLRGRCVVPAQFFYEWTPGLNGSRQPYLIERTDGAPLALAGLWSSWRTPDGREVGSCSILTCVANELLAQLHERMPVVLEASDIRTWLEAPPEAAARLAVPAGRGLLGGYPVDRRVGNVRNNEPSLIEAVHAPALRPW